MVSRETLTDSDGKKLHALKTHPEPFQALWDGIKRFEFRQNDRNFQVGDTLKLFEWDPQTSTESGRYLFSEVTYLIQGQFGIPDGYCVMSLGEPLLGLKRGKATSGD